MDNIKIFTGKVKYISHEVDEIATSLAANEMDFVSSIDINIKHIKTDGHEIGIFINQGYIKSKSKNDKILIINSSSHFKVVPYDEEIFKKPAPVLLINLLTDMVKIASAHNSGMFCIIREDYGMDAISPQPIPKGNLKNQIFNSVNRYLFS